MLPHTFKKSQVFRALPHFAFAVYCCDCMRGLYMYCQQMLHRATLQVEFQIACRQSDHSAGRGGTLGACWLRVAKLGRLYHIKLGRWRGPVGFQAEVEAAVTSIHAVTAAVVGRVGCLFARLWHYRSSRQPPRYILPRYVPPQRQSLYCTVQ